MARSSPFAAQCFFAGAWLLALPLLLQLISSIYFMNLATTGLNPTAAFMAILLLPWFSPSIRRLSLRIHPIAPAALLAAAACLVLAWQPGPGIRILLCSCGLFLLLVLLLRIQNFKEAASGIIPAFGLYGLYLCAGNTYRPNPVVDLPLLIALCGGWLVALARSHDAVFAEQPPALHGAAGPRPTTLLMPGALGFWLFAQIQFFQYPGTITAWTSLPVPAVGAIFLLASFFSLHEGAERLIRRIPAAAMLVASGIAAADLSSLHVFPAASLMILMLVLLDSLKRICAALELPGTGSRVRFGLPSTLVMLLAFAWTFTATYDQAKLLGSEYFRDQAPTMLFLVALVAALPVLSRTSPRTSGTPGRRALLLLVIGGVLCLAFTFRRNANDAAPHASSFRVATFNIYQGFDPRGFDNRRKLLDFARSEQPQILALQESDTSRPSSQNGNLVLWLARNLDLHSFYGPAPGAGSYGVSTLSQSPILRFSVMELPSNGEQAHLVLTRHRLEGRELNFLNTHFGLSDEDHTQQTEETIRWIRSIRGPIILAGDFNLDPKKAIDRRLLTRLVSETGLTDVLAAGGYGDAIPPGKATHRNGRRIDTIFVSPDFRILRARVLQDVTVSDHYPVLADLQWRR